jgi:hypothetical protein
MAIPLQMDESPENSWSLQVGVLEGIPLKALFKE